jgi:hypothetical protein
MGFQVLPPSVVRYISSPPLAPAVLAMTTCGFLASTETAAKPQPGFAIGVMLVQVSVAASNFHTAPLLPPPGPAAVL